MKSFYRHAEGYLLPGLFDAGIEEPGRNQNSYNSGGSEDSFHLKSHSIFHALRMKAIREVTFWCRKN
ncbi:MAG TPA: hypothetical protein VJ723_04945, partial [Candidatus Angelobacter sp.]|nr:hypothetical protein [Candidatus Angelobacter sp.]